MRNYDQDKMIEGEGESKEHTSIFQVRIHFRNAISLGFQRTIDQLAHRRG
jgi:hypothetical protein